MKSSKRKIFTVLAVIALAIMLCFALLACDNKTNTPGQNGGQNGDENTQVSVSTIDDLSEIIAALVDNYSVSEKVLASAQRKYGSSLAVLKSENADGTGELLVGTDEDGALKVATTTLALSADDFTARVFKSGTFTKTGDKISYYQGGKKQEEDISGAFTKTAENGDLTVIDATKADQKISVVFDNVTLEESGLNTEITNTDKEIFILVVGNAISADKEVFLPSLSLTYDSEANKTLVKAICYSGGKITVYTVSFAGNITADGFNKDEAQNQIYRESATITTTSKDCSLYADFAAIKPATISHLNVTKVPSAEELEEEIVLTSWDEVFNVFGEENSQKVKDMINKILTEKLLTDQTLKSIFKITDPNTQSKNIETLKWAFNITDDEITSVQVLAQRNEYPSSKESWVKSYQFELQNNVSLETITGKSNVNKVVEGDYILSDGDKYLDFTAFSEQVESVSYKQIYAFYSPMLSEKATDEEKAEQQEKLNIFNLLMPYAVSEKTLYSHVSVSYLESSAIPGYDLAYVFTIKCYNEIANNYEQKSFTVKSYRKDGLTIEKSCEQAIDKGEFEVKDLSSVQMIFGDIIFNVGKGNENVIEISPYSQQSVSEKQ